MFVNKNLNPLGKKVGDCTIRAVAAACNIPWDKAYELMARAGYELKCDMTDLESVEVVLKAFGFREGKIKVSKGERRPTVSSFAEDNPNIVAVLRVAHHLVACAYGNYVDTWDSGSCSVYKYWYKEINK